MLCRQDIADADSDMSAFSVLHADIPSYLDRSPFSDGQAYLQLDRSVPTI